MCPALLAHHGTPLPWTRPLVWVLPVLDWNATAQAVMVLARARVERVSAPVPQFGIQHFLSALRQRLVKDDWLNWVTITLDKKALIRLIHTPPGYCFIILIELWKINTNRTSFQCYECNIGTHALGSCSRDRERWMIRRDSRSSFLHAKLHLHIYSLSLFVIDQSEATSSWIDTLLSILHGIRLVYTINYCTR